MNESFLHPEMRGDYYVSTEKKKLWAVQLEIVDEIKRICKKYNLTFYTDGGTLIGAVRHKGFIPWDDDIDIQMLVKDYKVFCEVAPKELSYPYFFQHYTTEDKFKPWYAKIRRSDTTGCTIFEKEIHPEWNRGIFVDIFPLYNIPDSKIVFRWKLLKLMFLRAKILGFHSELSYMLGNKGIKNKLDIKRVLWNISKNFTTYEKICDRYLSICENVSDNTRQIGATAFLPGNKKAIYDRSLYDSTVELPFEFTTLRCPIGYDARLRVQYGDYMIVKRGTQLHTDMVYDADTPYEQYDFQQKNLKGGNDEV